MNEQMDHLDQAEKEIFTYSVSDEALEAAAGTTEMATRRTVQTDLPPIPD
jgi:hypothetical protein